LGDGKKHPSCNTMWILCCWHLQFRSTGELWKALGGNPRGRDVLARTEQWHWNTAAIGDHVLCLNRDAARQNIAGPDNPVAGLPPSSCLVPQPRRLPVDHAFQDRPFTLVKVPHCQLGESCAASGATPDCKEASASATLTPGWSAGCVCRAHV
jgi:hypothetical protein